MIRRIILFISFLITTELVFAQEYFNKNITLEVLKGNSIRIDSLRGNIIVINIWKTNCRPCIEEIPSLNKLVYRYSNSRVVFLAITTENSDKVSKFLEHHEFKFRQIVNGEKFINLNENKFITHLPVSFIIDRKGRLRFKKKGGDEKIDEILAKQIDILLKE